VVSRPSHSNTLAGWREWVQLPDIGVPWVKAKLDTGAQTSSIHAYDIVEFTRDGAEWVRFRVRPWQKSVEDQVEVELPVYDRRVVRSSNGQSEERVVVKMPMELVGRRVSALVTLTNRDHMGFRMLVGREALKHGFDVTSSRSYLGERAPKQARRRNRGRDAE
jgi:hypothetical protein